MEGFDSNLLHVENIWIDEVERSCDTVASHIQGSDSFALTPKVSFPIFSTLTEIKTLIPEQILFLKSYDS